MHSMKNVLSGLRAISNYFNVSVKRNYSPALIGFQCVSHNHNLRDECILNVIIFYLMLINANDYFMSQKGVVSTIHYSKIMSYKIKIYTTGVGRRIESCRHNCLLLGALNGHFLIFTLQIFFFCRHMWRCGDHLPTSVQWNNLFHCFSGKS